MVYILKTLKKFLIANNKLNISNLCNDINQINNKINL